MCVCIEFNQRSEKLLLLVSFCTFYQKVRNWLSFWNCYGISYYFEIQNHYVTTSTILNITICNQLDFDYELLHTDLIVWRTFKIFPCNQKFTGEIIDIIKDVNEPSENVELYVQVQIWSHYVNLSTYSTKSRGLIQGLLS